MAYPFVCVFPKRKCLCASSTIHEGSINARENFSGFSSRKEKHPKRNFPVCFLDFSGYIFPEKERRNEKNRLRKVGKLHRN
ncbi:MAG: hypothetical protein J6331_04185, partial [Lentisphaeria bacterium]|nr:hypothetical protein [Lentisphaeria bacterium]